MDKILDERLDRLGRALSTLVTAVTQHNPTTVQAEELMAADTGVQEGLIMLQHHQANHIRIQELRAATDALDRQIRDTFQTLASARKELRDLEPVIPTANVPKYPVTCNELLDYARRISKTTMPPRGVTNGVGPVVAEAQQQQQQQPQRDVDSGAGTDQQQQPPPRRSSTSTTTTPRLSHSPLPNGAPPTPAAPTPSQLQTPVPSTQNPAPTTAPENPNTTLPTALAAHMNPHHGARFFPWPTEEMMRRGALATIQALAEQGIDPRGYDPAVEEARRRREEDERREREERERRERQDMERAAWEERERVRREREREAKSMVDGAGVASLGVAAAAAPAPAVGRVGAAGAGAAAPDRKQFQFASFDDEDEDEDEDG